MCQHQNQHYIILPLINSHLTCIYLQLVRTLALFQSYAFLYHGILFAYIDLYCISLNIVSLIHVNVCLLYLFIFCKEGDLCIPIYPHICHSSFPYSSHMPMQPTGTIQTITAFLIQTCVQPNSITKPVTAVLSQMC